MTQEEKEIALNGFAGVQLRKKIFTADELEEVEAGKKTVQELETQRVQQQEMDYGYHY